MPSGESGTFGKRQGSWSRNVLVHQIETNLFDRQGHALTNFDKTLPAPQSDLAQQLIKDPYNFDFLTFGPGAQERDLERSLIEHVRDFMLELGKGSAFVGSQYSQSQMIEKQIKEEVLVWLTWSVFYLMVLDSALVKIHTVREYGPA